MADDIKIVGLSTKKSSGTNWKVISAIIGIIVLSIGVIAGILLVRQNQNIEEKALECSAGGAACPDSSNPGLLRDCSTGEAFPNDSLCNSTGRVEVCGTSASNAKQYCCPVAGGAWTADLTKCNVVKPTPTAPSSSCQATGPDVLKVEDVTSSEVTLKWAGGTGDKATVWLSEDQDLFESCINNASTCKVNAVKVDFADRKFIKKNLKPNQTYYWAITAWISPECKDNSTIQNFKTLDGVAPTATSTSTSVSTPTSTSTSTSKATMSATATSAGKTATPTSTTKATSTATAKATTTGSATAFPVPETGAEWPTVIGAGFGVIMLLVSLALAL